MYEEKVEEFWLYLNVDGKGGYKKDKVRDRGDTGKVRFLKDKNLRKINLGGGNFSLSPCT